MKKKNRIDVMLVQQNMAESREKAKRIIMAGLVYVNGQIVDKAGTEIPLDADIEVRGKGCKYVSRGGLKLEKAIDLWKFELADKVCIDIGASTGGFTDCMLQNNAKIVYAIDVGYGQLDTKLRNDARVVNMERTHIVHLDTNEIQSADFVSIDVSFISLKKVLPVAYDLINDNASIVFLIKPQFEVGKIEASKNKGVIKNIQSHKAVLLDILNFAVEYGFSIIGLTFSPIKGASGNIEFLAYAQKIEKNGHNIDTFEIDYEVEKAVNIAHNELSVMKRG